MTLQLLMGNFFTSVGVKSLSKFFLALGEILVSLIGGIMTYLVVAGSKNPDMVISPVLLSVLITYIVSFYVMHIVEITIDTIYLCFQYERTFLVKGAEKGLRSYAPRELVGLMWEIFTSSQSLPLYLCHFGRVVKATD